MSEKIGDLCAVKMTWTGREDEPLPTTISVHSGVDTVRFGDYELTRSQANLAKALLEVAVERIPEASK